MGKGVLPRQRAKLRALRRPLCDRATSSRVGRESDIHRRRRVRRFRSWFQAFDSESASIEIGDGTSIAGNCVLSAAASIRIGKRVLFARNVYIADHMHAFEDASLPVLDQGIQRRGPVEVGDGAWLGQNVLIGPGVRVGRGPSSARTPSCSSTSLIVQWLSEHPRASFAFSTQQRTRLYSL